MKLIGLAGPLRVGKDTIADYLVEQHGFLKFSFTDALYTEVQKSYGLADQYLLREADRKEVPTSFLALRLSDNEAFRQACASYVFGDRIDIGAAEYTEFLHEPRSPRWVMQRWGTEYRRRTCGEDYWLKRCDDYLKAVVEKKLAGELPDLNGLVNTSVRFANEKVFLNGWAGEIWHVFRRAAPKSTEEMEQHLPITGNDREVHNNGSIEKLHTAVSLMLSGVLRDAHIED